MQYHVPGAGLNSSSGSRTYAGSLDEGAKGADVKTTCGRLDSHHVILPSVVPISGLLPSGVQRGFGIADVNSIQHHAERNVGSFLRSLISHNIMLRVQMLANQCVYYLNR